MPRMLRPEPDAAPADAPDAATRPGRIALLDAARGLALLGMVVFHLEWDLAHFGYVRTLPSASTAWTAFGHVVAAAFLVLSGVGLMLARDRGLRPALRRIARIAGCAAAVTVVTAWLFPQETVTFGILHCIAATNLIALAFLRAPLWIVVAAAMAAVTAPALLTTGATEGPPWWWLGLSSSVPRTLDYRPVLPWLGLALVGVAAARVLPLTSLPILPARLSSLALAGRHSLVIYLVHQPILFGLLWLVSPAPLTEGIDAFMPACQSECQAAGAGAEGCRAACLCAAQHFADVPAAEGPPKQNDIAETCVRQLR